MGKPYSQELDAFASTYAWANQQDVGQLSHFLARWSGDHVVIVGSGGSFSAAVAASLFRELAHHSPTSPVTPLDFASLVNRLSPKVLLLSAEGKNKDILNAAHAARMADLSTGAMTLTSTNPLLDLGAQTDAMRAFVFPSDWVKDGYLATNSLVAMTFLFYKAFFGVGEFEHRLGPFFDAARLHGRREKLALLANLAAIRSRGLLLLHSASAKTFAVDLESKLSEAALAFVQVTDLRQFAHGRHLQLSVASPRPVILFVSSCLDQALARSTAELLSDQQDVIELVLEGSCEQDIAMLGLVDAMFLTEAIAAGSGIDPGQPDVPEFGRAIHAIDSAALVGRSELNDRLQLAARRKSFGVGHVAGPIDDRVVAAASAFAAQLAAAPIRGLVCDFDGTLCRAENRFDEVMEPVHVEQISVLLQAGLGFAIATGRGDSLHKSLQKSFNASVHSQILVGYYNGSYIARLDEQFKRPEANPAFHELCDWLKGSVFGRLCKDVDHHARAGQFSIRLNSAHQARRVSAAIRCWLNRTGRHGWRAFVSGHSIDVLDETADKRLVVARLADQLQVQPKDQILRIGDSGQEDGNDFELLSEGLSLSCDAVSSDLASAWNFGSPGSNQVEVTSSYLRGLVRRDDGVFRLSPTALGINSLATPQ